MSITTEIQRIQTAKASIKTAIETKGVVVGEVTIDQYPALINQIKKYTEITASDYSSFGSAEEYLATQEDGLYVEVEE